LCIKNDNYMLLDVIIRTNGGTLTVDAKNDTIYYYGNSELAIINHIAQESFHVFGAIALVNLKDGNLVIENAGFTNKIDISEATGTVKAEIKGILGQEAPSDLNITGSGINGLSTISNLDIDTAEKLQALAYVVNMGNSFEGKEIKLINDVDISTLAWIPIGTETHPFKGTFNGNNNIISGLTNKNKTASQLDLDINTFSSGGSGGVYGLFGYIQNAYIKNLTLEKVKIEEESLSMVGCIAGVAIGNIKLENCVVQDGSTIIAYKKNGGLIGMLSLAELDYDAEAFIIGCTNYCDVTSKEARASGLIGDMPLTGSKQRIVNIINCKNEGKITAQYWVSAICSHIYNGQEAYINITNCSNNGLLASADGKTGLLGRAANLQKNNATNADYGCRVTVTSCFNMGEKITKNNCWAVIDTECIGDNWFDAINQEIADFRVID